MVIKKIFDGNCDDEVHSDFLKFGRGEYKDRYLLEGKKQSSKFALKTGPEFANHLVSFCLANAPEEVSVKGIIVSTTDLRDEIPFEIKKASNFQGIRKFQIDTPVKSDSLRSLMEKFPRAFFALSFSTDSHQLKIKAKAPKSGKPGKESEDGPKADFCSLKTTDSSILEDLFFDHKGFKEIVVTHTVHVTDIVYPQNFQSLKPSQVRELSKRKGVLTRKVVVDGKEVVSEKEFVA